MIIPLKDKTKWHKHFVLVPKVFDTKYGPKLVWLQTIYRRRDWYWGWEYSSYNPEDES